MSSRAPPPSSNLIWLAAGGGVIALVLILGIVFAVRALTAEPPAQSQIQASDVGGRDQVSAAKEGMQARGTAELRAIGCTQATVIDVTRLKTAPQADEPRYVVTCDVASGDAPTCERVATTYFTALGPTVDGNVSVRVARRGSPPSCVRTYAPSGADLGGI